MAGEIILPEVSTPSTPASGKDALFMSSATPARPSRVDSAGTVWLSQEFVLLSNTADYTLTNAGAAEKALNGSTNGTITLPGSQSWQFDLQYLLTNTGTTSHTWGILFGGTATLTSGAMWAMSVSATSNALTAPSQIYSTTLGSVLVVTAASTSATENVIIKASGIIRINAAGTLIPQIKASAATTGTAKVLANSYFRMSPFGADTTAAQGNWS